MTRSARIATAMVILTSIFASSVTAAKPTVHLAEQTIDFVGTRHPKSTKNLRLLDYDSARLFNSNTHRVNLNADDSLEFQLTVDKKVAIELAVNAAGETTPGGADPRLTVELYQGAHPKSVGPAITMGRAQVYNRVIPASLLNPGVHKIRITNSSLDTTIVLSTVSISSNSATWLGLTDEQFASETDYLTLAQHNSAEFAWRLFVRANRTVSGNYDAPTEKVRHWEAHWPTNAQTFPKSGAPVAWAKVESSLHQKEFTSPFLAQILDPKTAVVGVTKDEEKVLNLGTVVEEIRRNRDTYDYIRTHGYFCADIVAGGSKPSFPKGSVELKAEWRKGSASDAARYYTADYKGDTYLLIGLHLMSKALPTWFWATWEHQDNPLRGKLFTSQNDQFGFSKADLGPTSQLKTLFADADMDELLWANYRLVNWQNAYDQPLVAGNSVIEGTLTRNTSSCITCHKIASASGAKKNATLVGDVAFAPPDMTLPKTVKEKFDSVTPIGAPKARDVTLTFKKSGYLGDPTITVKPGHAKTQGPARQPATIFVHPFDFVWSLFRAKQHGQASCKGVSP